MRKRLLLTLGVLLSGYLPAAAQGLSTQVRLKQENPAPVALAAGATQLRLTTFPPAQPLEQRPARFTVLLAAVYKRDRSPEGSSAAEVVKTPFARQARLTLVRLWGGRLQLGGFESTRYMGNVLLGYSDSSGLPGSSVCGQGHPGARVPRQEKIYGLSLTFHLGRDARAGPRIP